MKLFLILLVSLVCFDMKVNSSNSMNPFVASLHEEQKEQLFFDFEDQTKEAWHYFPSEMFPRKGLLLKDLTPEQKLLFDAVLREFLSEKGVEKTRNIMLVEQILGEIESAPEYRDPEKYHISVYGKPTTDRLWAWSIEGHHISYNFTVLDGKISSSPRFMGANPGEVKKGPNQGLRALSQEEDLAFNLLHSFSPEQKESAIIQTQAYSDILTRNQSIVAPLSAEGIEMSRLNGEQQELLWAIIQEYLSSLPVTVAQKRAQEIQDAEFSAIKFAWAGASEKGIGHYYRIQGSSFLIEFDNTQNGANHIHSVWREFSGDFGRDLIHEHVQKVDHD